MTQFEKDLTHFLRPGKNQLVIYVRSESLASGISKISHYAKHQIISKDIRYEFSPAKRNIGFSKEKRRTNHHQPVKMYAIPHLKENEVIDYIPQERTGNVFGFTSEPLKDWILESESIEQTDKGVSITVRGKYGENPAELVLLFRQ